MKLYDKNRIPIEVGDVLKVFHYIGARGKKCYMYKQVVGWSVWKSGSTTLRVSHLNLTNVYYCEDETDSVREDIEIVQGYGRNETHFSERKRKP